MTQWHHLDTTIIFLYEISKYKSDNKQHGDNSAGNYNQLLAALFIAIFSREI